MPGAERLVAILIIFPFLTAILCYWVRISGIRSFVVLLTGGLLIISAVLLILLTPFSFWPQPALGVGIHTIVQVLDFLLLLVPLQIIFLFYFEFCRPPTLEVQWISFSMAGIVCR